MGDMGEFWKDVKDYRKERRAELGVDCPECVRLLPKAQPKVLLPGQRCTKRGHKYVDRRSGQPQPDCGVA